MKKKFIKPQSEIFLLKMETAIAVGSSTAAAPSIDEDTDTGFSAY